MDKPHSAPLNILLVEDDEEDYTLVRELLSGLLASASTLRWVPGYDEARSALLSGQFDVCLLDCRLGARSGLELLEEATGCGCATPIIFLTRRGDCQTDYTAMKGGAAGYLDKSEMSPSLLERTIRYCLARARELSSANKALGETRFNYRVLAENVPGMVFQFVLHSDGSYSLPFVNNRIEEYAGVSAQAAMRDASLLFTPIHPDDREMVQKAIAVSAKTLEDFYLEHRIIHTDGRIRWFRVVSRPQRLPNGDIIWNGICLEITESKRSEELLLESRAWFHSLFEYAPLPYQSLDECGCFFDVNPKWLDVLGYEKDEVVGRSFGDFLAPCSRDDFVRNFAHFKQRGVIKGVQFDMVKKSGEIIRASFDGRIQRDEERFVCTHCILQDITEQKHMEESLRASEELFRTVFEHHAAVKLIVDPETGKIINANRAAENFYGWPKERLKQMRVYDINTLSAEEVGREMAKARALEKVHFEFRHRLADGSIRDVDVFSSKIAVRGKELLHTIIHDITERKQAREILNKERRRFRQILDQFPYGIYIVDADFQMEYVNPIIRRELGEVGDRKCYDYFYGLQEPCSWCHNEEVFQGRTVRWSWHFAKGKRDYEVVDLPLYNEDGTISKLAVFNNVTGRKKAEQEREKLQQQLVQSQKMESVGRLAGGVAHDYNNMLAVIMGYTEMALLSVSPEDPLHADLEEILKAAKRSADVTRQLLAFARKQTVSPVVFDLNQTVESMLKMLRPLIGEDIALAWLPGAGSLPVKMDPSQLDQILANLCVNARDAVAGVGKVTIETDGITFDETYCAAHSGFVAGEFVLLAVSDDGCGMEKETLENIFEPFFTTKDIDKGTGLGLSTVYGIVKQNDGFINVYSEPGRGTTFRIYLPCAKVEVSREQRRKGEKKDLKGSETILLVEDELFILALGKAILKRYGYTVLTASNPLEALRIAKSHLGPVHLLITDVVMPEMNGKELRDQLQALKYELKCIFMSGYTANVIAQHGVLEEGVNFLQKPFSVRALAQKARDVLDA
ncbi:MAG: PAS domain S-box protein [Syntrophobacteraceae bacterium]